MIKHEVEVDGIMMFIERSKLVKKNIPEIGFDEYYKIYTQTEEGLKPLIQKEREYINRMENNRILREIKIIEQEKFPRAIADAINGNRQWLDEYMLQIEELRARLK